MGSEWLDCLGFFCVKRVYVFCRRDLHHIAKALQPLLAPRSNPDQASLGKVLIPTTQIKNAPKRVLIFIMGRVVGLSWIFCVKRVYVFCRRDLHHFAKALRTLQKIRSNHRQTCRPVGFSEFHNISN